jgi:hypothetical protein
LNAKKKAKKGGAAKKGAKNKKAEKVEKTAELEDLFGLDYNHFTNMREFVIDLKEYILIIHLLSLEARHSSYTY